MSDRSYNGWTNYETWLLNIWADENGWMSVWIEDAKNIFDEADAEYITRPDGNTYQLFSKEKVAKSDIIDYLKDYIDSEVMDMDTNTTPRLSDGNHGFLVDILKAAIDRIDLAEIADHVFDALAVCEQ